MGGCKVLWRDKYRGVCWSRVVRAAKRPTGDLPAVSFIFFFLFILEREEEGFLKDRLRVHGRTSQIATPWMRTVKNFESVPVAAGT